MATKSGIHYLDPRLLRGPVKVVVVGAGGSGSHMASNLAVLHQSMIDLGHPYGLECTLIDDDAVAEANIGRARFYASDTGQNKAFVLANRINLCHGQTFRAINARLDGKAGSAKVIQDADIVIGCVDTRESRRAIHKALHGRNVLKTCYWLDLGNGSLDGQVLLGEVGRGDDLLPCVTALYPEILDARQDPKDDGPSCSRAEALTKQSAFVNASAAMHAVSMLSVLFWHGQIEHCGVFFNLRTGRSSTLPCQPDAWERLAGAPVPLKAVKSRRGAGATVIG